MADRTSSASKFGLSSREKVKIPLLYLGIGIATAIGFFASFLIGQQSLLLAGLGVVAYVFGLRHGVDADHIVAIDNTTRKLMQEGKRPLTVGTWFSLGHSTIVFALVVGLILATRAITDQIPALQSAGTAIGLAVSGFFLILIGLINVVIVLDIHRVFVGLQEGRDPVDSAALEETLNKRGFLNRFFRSLFQLIREPWQIYPIGVLFGLGFDTASEVALLGLAATSGANHLPILLILVLPALVAAMRQLQKGQHLQLLYPGGDAGSLWAHELRAWLVALGLSSQRIELLPGSRREDAIEVRVAGLPVVKP